MPVSTRVAGLGVFLPETTRSTADTERRLRAANPHVRLATGLIKRMTGVHTAVSYTHLTLPTILRV